jgi:type IV pilus assembly protein PilX
MTKFNINVAQRGFALFMSLVTLVIITISGIAMMRIMEAGTTAAGNIAFRQAAARIADVAAEDAREKIIEIGTTGGKPQLAVDDGNFYYATMKPISYDPAYWDPPKSVQLSGTVSGYTVNYVIHRIAVQEGLCETINVGCSFSPKASTDTIGSGASQSGSLTGYSSVISEGEGLVYYRVTVKVSGPRHNISYMQGYLY